MRVLFFLFLLFHASLALASDALERALDATLVLRSDDTDARFLGSGFLMQTPKGVVAVSNAHVVGDRASVVLEFSDGRQDVAPVLGRDQLRDIAVMETTRTTGLPVAAQPALGQPVFALGAPLQTAGTLSRGIISARPRQIDPKVPLLFLQHDAAINSGSSGGPLVDESGDVLGMNSRIADGSRFFVGISYAISAKDIARAASRLRRGIEPRPYRLGIRLRPLDRRMAAALGRLRHGGVLVEEVQANSAAERAGLLAGDVIETANGTRLVTPGQMAFVLADRALDQPLALQVSRGGAPLEIDMFLSAFHPLVPEEENPDAGRRAVPLSALGLAFLPSGRIGPVDPNTAAHFAGFEEGDRIRAIDGQVTGDASSFAMVRPVLVLVEDQSGRTRHLMLDPWSDLRPLRPVGGSNAIDPSVVAF